MQRVYKLKPYAFVYTISLRLVLVKIVECTCMIVEVSLPVLNVIKHRAQG